MEFKCKKCKFKFNEKPSVDICCPKCRSIDIEAKKRKINKRDKIIQKEAGDICGTI